MQCLENSEIMEESVIVLCCLSLCSFSEVRWPGDAARYTGYLAVDAMAPLYLLSFDHLNKKLSFSTSLPSK